MIRNFLTIGGWTLVSRVLGLVRDLLLAIYLGAGAAQDAFQIAFRLPNMFRRLFGEGALNAAFVPLFTESHVREGHKKSSLIASDALSGLFSLLLGITVIGEIFMPWVIRFIAPGFATSGVRFHLAVTLAHITFPYLLLICCAALCAGVLNGLDRMALAAGAYVSFNVVGIAAILIGAHFLHRTAESAAWGVTLSGVVQFGLLFFGARRAGARLRFGRPHLSLEMRVLLRRFGPGLIGSGVTQLNLTVDTMIATLLPSGSIAWLYFADRINQLPLGVLGAAVGTALLPALSRHLAVSDGQGARDTLNRAIDFAMILALPAAFGLIALAPEILATLFNYGHFTTLDALKSAQSLRAYAIGLPAFILVKVLCPSFFASGDTRTPVLIGFGILALNLGLNLLLYRPLAHIGPPIASSIAACANVMLLGLILYRRHLLQPSRNLVCRMSKVSSAAALMAVEGWFMANIVFTGLVHWHTLPRLCGLSFLIFSSGGIYVLFAYAMGIRLPKASPTLRLNSTGAHKGA